MSTALWTPSGASLASPLATPHPFASSRHCVRSRIEAHPSIKRDDAFTWYQNLDGIEVELLQCGTLSTKADTWSNSAGSCTRSCGLDKTPRINRMVVVHDRGILPRFLWSIRCHEVRPPQSHLMSLKRCQDVRSAAVEVGLFDGVFRLATSRTWAGRGPWRAAPSP